MTPLPSSIDLRSDTVTRPGPEMRIAMAEAAVGDHVLGDDPTAAELEQVAAEMLGKERALFFPSGTMANQTAILLQARAGTEVLLDAGSHILHFEEAAAAAWGGVQLRTFPVESGVPVADRIAEVIRPPSPYVPECSLVCFENTHNTAGGRVVSVEAFQAVAGICRQAGLSIHLDGARLPNAAVALDTPMRRWADLADTVMISLSKGLGAPIGSILAGPAELMERAWRVRRRLGGGMRQVGIIAAAGLFALRENFARLSDDHRRARDLAEAISRLPGLHAETPQTNIVMVDVDPALGSSGELAEMLDRHRLHASDFGPRLLRAVTHLDIDDEGIARAIAAFEAVVPR